MPRDFQIPSDLGPLTPESRNAIMALAHHVPEREPCPGAVPAYRRAAVLLALFNGRKGDLYVILSQRAMGLRSHGGDTAIPGGRFELEDSDLEATARREAWEECGLPIDPKRAVKLCELKPFLSANELVVTPIVVLIVDQSMKPSLNPNEVASLFSVPFAAFLEHDPPASMRASLHLPVNPDPQSLAAEPRSEVKAPSDWHLCRDIGWLGHRIRRHTFWDTRNPIRGLTSDILIHAAMVGYRRAPSFVVSCPGEPSSSDLIKVAFTGPLAIRKRRVRPRMFGLPQPIDDKGQRALKKDEKVEEVKGRDKVGEEVIGGGAAGETGGKAKL